jgi:hypothetical protein
MDPVLEIYAPGLRFWNEQRRFEKERMILIEAPGSNPHQARVDIDRRIVYLPTDEADAGLATDATGVEEEPSN